EQYPDEQRESVELLLRLLEDSLAGLEPDATDDRLRLDAVAIYHLAVGTMHQHIRDGTRPRPAEIEHLIQFSLAAVASNGKGEPPRARRAGPRRRRHEAAVRERRGQGVGDAPRAGRGERHPPPRARLPDDPDRGRPDGRGPRGGQRRAVPRLRRR